MRCSQCGRENVTGSNHCADCGAKLPKFDFFARPGNLTEDSVKEHDEQRMPKKGANSFYIPNDLNEDAKKKTVEEAKVVSEEKTAGTSGPVRGFYIPGDAVDGTKKADVRKEEVDWNRRTDSAATKPNTFVLAGDLVGGSDKKEKKSVVSDAKEKSSKEQRTPRKKTALWASCGAIAAACIVFLFVLFFRNDNGYVAPDNQGITKAEWVTMLAENFGMKTYTSASPYYSDVSAKHSAYTYVQSCYEWGVLRENDKFKPNSTATREFVAETAMLAVGLDYSSSYASKSASELLDIAYREGIMQSKNGQDKMTREECMTIIEKLKAYYFDKEWEDYENIQLKSGVKDYSNNPLVTLEDTVVSMPAVQGNGIVPGQIVIVPGYPTAVARKVVSVETQNDVMVLQTATPALEEVFEELDFYYTAVPELKDITPAQEGVTISGLSNAYIAGVGAQTGSEGYTATQLALGDKKHPISFSVKVDLVSGKLTPKVEFANYFSFEAEQRYKEVFGRTITEESGKFFQEAQLKLFVDENNKPRAVALEKWEAGYEILGTLEISNLYVEVKCQGLMNAVVAEVHMEAESSLSYKGKLEGEVPIFKTLVPVSVGIHAEVTVYLYTDVNGDIQLGAKMTHDSSWSYAKGNSKIVQDTNFEASLAGSVSVEAGLKAELIPYVFGIELVDVSAKVGCEFEAKAVGHLGEDGFMVCYNSSVNLPIVSISAGMKDQTVAHKLGIKVTLNIMDKENAWVESLEVTLRHVEITASGIRKVAECTWGEEEVETPPQGNLELVYEYVLSEGVDTEGNEYKLVANQKESATGYEITVGVIKNNKWLYEPSTKFPFLDPDDNLFHVSVDATGNSGYSLKYYETIKKNIFFVDIGAFAMKEYHETSGLSIYDQSLIVFSCTTLQSYEIDTKEYRVELMYLDVSSSRRRVVTDDGRILLYKEELRGSVTTGDMVYEWSVLDCRTLEVNVIASEVLICPKSILSEGLIFASDKCFYDVNMQKKVDLNEWIIDMYSDSDIYFINGQCTFKAKNRLGSIYEITIDIYGNVLSEVKIK